MCVKLPPRDLNPKPCPPHPTNTYTCIIILVLKCLVPKKVKEVELVTTISPIIFNYAR